ncbi:hypothetical protein [Streptomyces sp. ODS28]|uniref:hypothetical protein n=1 Tax=Streptomyces sp. ODS28 TaxID=3136688 RepID=UPI0031E59533
MLALRLILRAHPLALLGIALLLCASGAAGLLSLDALARAVAAPHGRGDTALPRLLWCAVPLSAVCGLAASLARAVPGPRTRAGLAAAGLGPAGLPLAAAVVAGFCALAGSAGAALPAELAPGAVGRLRTPAQELPLPAAATLLALAPLAAAAGAFWGARRAAVRAEAPADARPSVRHGRNAVLVGAALGTVGLALLTVVARLHLLADGGTPGRAALGAGWLLLASGLVAAGPGAVHWCGRAVAAGHPGTLRMVCGRVLEGEAARTGRHFGLLCAVGAATVAALRLYGTVPAAPSVPALLTLPVCAAAGALAAYAAAGAERARAAGSLLLLGAPRPLVRQAAFLRGLVLLGVLLPASWLAGTLAAVPVLRGG